MKTILSQPLEIASFETPQPYGPRANALRDHTFGLDVPNPDPNMMGCVPCKKASAAVVVSQITKSRLVEVIVRTIREIGTNGVEVQTNKRFLVWARGVLTKKGSHKKGFEFKICTPPRINPRREIYGDVRASTAWATRLILCQTFQWDRCKFIT